MQQGGKQLPGAMLLLMGQIEKEAPHFTKKMLITLSEGAPPPPPPPCTSVVGERGGASTGDKLQFSPF